MIRSTMVCLATMALLVAVGCNRKAGGSTPAGSEENNTAPVAAEAASSPAAAGASRTLDLGGLGACTADASVVHAVERTARLADADGDGSVSREEAAALTNFIVGGAFFRADSNSDGTITPAEGRELRGELLRRNPGFQALLLAAGQKRAALTKVAELAGVDYGSPLTLEEARKTASAFVGDLFGWLDQNQDDSIDPGELRHAALEGARSLGRAAFAAADANGDGGLTKAELRALLEQPLDGAFAVSDRNHDGKLGVEEAGAAVRHVSSWAGIPAALTSDKAAPPATQPRSKEEP